MPNGKPANVRCIQLDDNNDCRLFGQPERPQVCRRLRPESAMCGQTRAEALQILITLECATVRA